MDTYKAVREVELWRIGYYRDLAETTSDPARRAALHDRIKAQQNKLAAMRRARQRELRMTAQARKDADFLARMARYDRGCRAGCE